MSVVKATLRMKPRLRPRSRISRLATSQMLRQRGITPPPGSRPPVSGVTASMNSSDSFGGSYENVRTSPAARARASRPSRSTSRSTSSLTLSPVRSSTCSVVVAVEPVALRAGHLDLEVLAARGGLELVDGARGDDPAAGDDHDVLADVLDEVELVAAEDDAGAGRRLLADDLGHRRDADRVEPGERLVEDEQLRVVDERRGELDALLVAVRQLLELGLRAVAEAHPLEPLGRPRRWPPCPTCRAAGRSS